MASLSTPIPSSTAAYGYTMASALAPDALAKAKAAKAREQAQDFEAVFLNQMFSQMFTAMDGDGPFGGGKTTGIWRSFLTDEYAKTFARNGGVGIADHVYRELIRQQEAQAPHAATGATGS
jgi:Rod binding domain-containing protein